MSRPNNAGRSLKPDHSCRRDEPPSPGSVRPTAGFGGFAPARPRVCCLGEADMGRRTSRLDRSKMTHRRHSYRAALCYPSSTIWRLAGSILSGLDCAWLISIVGLVANDFPRLNQSRSVHQSIALALPCRASVALTRSHRKRRSYSVFAGRIDSAELGRLTKAAGLSTSSTCIRFIGN